ncbi:MAG: GspH/FimT family pseudopilin [Methylomicrobium sp.]|nr:GspH/FimT family pseudopilin [Methylomicrobium sp.]
MNNQTNQGFTLLEAMITIAIAAIILVLAVPSYRDVLERNRVREAVESLSSDIKLARTEAIKRSADVTLSVDNTEWCYGIGVGAAADACDCTAAVGDADFCNIKIVNGAQFQDIAFNGNNVTFEFRRGTPSAVSSSTLSSANYGAQVDVNPVGLVTICSSGARSLIHYPDC